MERTFPDISPDAVIGLEGSTLADITMQAYLQAEYLIHADPPFSLKVGAVSEPLRQLFARTGKASAAFITPYNPLGHLLSERENGLRLEELNAAMRKRGYTVLPADGLDPDGEWPPEKGVLVLGASLDDARDIGREFRQNGVLWCDAQAYVALVLLV